MSIFSSTTTAKAWRKWVYERLKDNTESAFTPTLGGNAALGNGTISGYYIRQGDLVYVTGQWILGSTSTLTGNFNFANLPFTVHADEDDSQLHVGLFENGVNTWLGVGSLTGSTKNLSIFTHADDGNGFIAIGTPTATVPFTWGTSDEVNFNGQYRIA